MVVLVIMTHLNETDVTHDSNLLAEFILVSINLSGAKFMNKMSASINSDKVNKHLPKFQIPVEKSSKIFNRSQGWLSR